MSVRKFILNLIGILIVCSVCLYTSPASAHSFPSQTITDTDKVWKVRFSDHIDVRSVEQSMVKIVNVEGKEILLRPLRIIDDVLEIEAATSYARGTYTIYIDADIKSVKGYTLSEASTFSFKVEDPDYLNGPEDEQQVASAGLQAIEANPVFVKLQLEQPVANLSLDDFTIAASSGTSIVPITIRSFSPEDGIVFYTIPDGYKNKEIEVVVTAKNSTKLSGEARTTFLYGDGVFGRVTNEQEKGIENALVLMNLQYDMMGSVMVTYTTKNGYYFMGLPYAANWDGEVQGKGYETKFVSTTVHEDIQQNEFNIVLKEDRRHLEWTLDVIWDGAQIRNQNAQNFYERFALYYSPEIDAPVETYKKVRTTWNRKSYSGPSILKMGDLQNGRYIFVVEYGHEQNKLDQSMFTVKKFRGSDLMETQSYQFEEAENSTQPWGFFELLVSNNGEEIQFNELLTFTTTRDVLKSPKMEWKTLVHEMSLNHNNLVGYESALEKAQLSVQQPQNISSKQYITHYNELMNYYPLTYKWKSVQSYLNISTTDAQSITDGIYFTANKPNLIRLNVSEKETGSSYPFLVGDEIVISYKVYARNELGEYIPDAAVKVKNIQTDEELHLKAEDNEASLKTMTYEEFLQLQDVAYAVEFGQSGRYEIQITLTVKNRTVEVLTWNNGIQHVVPSDELNLTVTAE